VIAAASHVHPVGGGGRLAGLDALGQVRVVAADLAGERRQWLGVDRGAVRQPDGLDEPDRGLDVGDVRPGPGEEDADGDVVGEPALDERRVRSLQEAGRERLRDDRAPGLAVAVAVTVTVTVTVTIGLGGRSVAVAAASVPSSTPVASASVAAPAASVAAPAASVAAPARSASAPVVVVLASSSPERRRSWNDGVAT
jgi:hypothetical protein